MRHLLVALCVAHLLGGCVATSHELEALRTQTAYERQETRALQARAEQRIARVEAKLQRIDRERSARSDQQALAKRLSAVEAELQRIGKKSALGLQMGLISSVHADSNDRGIAAIRAEVEKLTAEIKTLEARLLESDKQLESGLLQLRDISGKLK